MMWREAVALHYIASTLYTVAAIVILVVCVIERLDLLLL
jgi:hypothetical protein